MINRPGTCRGETANWQPPLFCSPLFWVHCVYTCLGHVGIVVFTAITGVRRTVNLDIAVASKQDHLFGECRYPYHCRRRHHRRAVCAEGYLKEEGNIDRIKPLIEWNRLDIQIDGDNLDIFTFDAQRIINYRLRPVCKEHLQVG